MGGEEVAQKNRGHKEKSSQDAVDQEAEWRRLHSKDANEVAAGGATAKRDVEKCRNKKLE